MTGWRHFPVGEITRAVDGDTLEVVLDLGFEVRSRIHVRLAYIDAPETVGESRGLGVAAKRSLAYFDGATCEVWTRRASFGRYEGFVLAEGAGDLGAWMIREGYAWAWDYGHAARRPWVSFPIDQAESAIELGRYETIVAKRLDMEPTIRGALSPEAYL